MQAYTHNFFSSPCHLHTHAWTSITYLITHSHIMTKQKHTTHQHPHTAKCYTNIHIHTHSCIHHNKMSTHIINHNKIHTHTHTHTRTHTHIIPKHAHVQTYTYTHASQENTHTHTHTHSHRVLWPTDNTISIQTKKCGDAPWWKLPPQETAEPGAGLSGAASSASKITIECQFTDITIN